MFHVLTQVQIDALPMAEQIAYYKQANALLASAKATNLRLAVSEKGAVSLYGMGQFPVTLYQEQWGKVLDYADTIRAFIAANKGSLKSKADQKLAKLAAAAE